MAPTTYRSIAAQTAHLMRDLAEMFAAAFDDADAYLSKRPSTEYLTRLLQKDSFIALAAFDGDTIVGGIVAYELCKFEQERSEIYLYDLAVAESHRRRGIATQLIRELQQEASTRGAYVIFVQANTSEEDAAAIALYTKLGTREDVLHFDIEVPKS